MFRLNINDYKKIEDRFQMQVNVFGYENKVYPLYISKKSYDQTLSLLLITEKDKSHYIFKHKHKKHHCMSYLPSFATEELLSNYKKTMFIN